MRVAFVTTSYPGYEGDGCGHFVETEARRTARKDEVFVVTAGSTPSLLPAAARSSSAANGGVGSQATRDDGEPRILRLAGHDAFGWPGVAARVRARPQRLLGAARWGRSARIALASLAPLDRIVAHWSLPCGWPVSTGLGVPLELVSHGADVRVLVASPAPVRRAVVESLLRDACSWRFVSSSLLEGFLQAVGAVTARRVERLARVEACAIDVPDVSAAAREKRALYAGEHLAVCVARLVPDKRVERVIDHVAREPVPRSHLVVVGDGPLRARLEQHAAARGVRVRFVGQTTRPDALAWIGAADVVLHASVAEGLSTVEREARALGVPFRRVGEDAQRDLR